MQENIQKKQDEFDKKFGKFFISSRNSFGIVGVDTVKSDDIKSFLQTALTESYEEGRKEAVVEHCSEPSCPECNLAAYNKGKEEGSKIGIAVGKGSKDFDRKFIEQGAYLKGRNNTIEECLKIADSDYTQHAEGESQEVFAIIDSYNTARQEIITRINQLRK